MNDGLRQSESTSSRPDFSRSPSQLPFPAQAKYTTAMPVTIQQASTTLTTHGPRATPSVTTQPKAPAMIFHTNKLASAALFLITISITVTSASSTFVTSSVTLVPANSPTESIGNVAALSNGSICIGQGIDATAIGVLSSLVLSSVVGLLLWLLFAHLRPKFRQIYSVREWFVSAELRPPLLGKSFWAFLWPPVPMVPSIPKDVSSYSPGRNLHSDAALWPSDEELTQRTLWLAFLLVLSWTVIGLGGALPLYLVNTPCLAESTPAGRLGGYYSTLQDLSVLRLLALVRDNNTASTHAQVRRGVAVDDAIVPDNIETRLIVLTVVVIVFAALPALFKFLREYTKLVTHRRHWIEVRCDGLEMGWLSHTLAQGFDGWGENELKDFIMRIGLSTGFKSSGAPRDGFTGVGAYGGRAARSGRGMPTEGDENAYPEIDLQGLFTIADTTRLSALVVERDVILNNLEVAETRYISSFKLSTPMPSVIDYEVPEEVEELEARAQGLKQRIGHPRALSSSVKRQRRHHRTATPTSYVAPSSYYKLRDVRGIGDMSSGDGAESLAHRISQRVIGSRFQEIHRDSVAFGRIPLGSHVQVNGRTGSFEPVHLSDDQLRHGPNDPSSGNQGETEEILEENEAMPDTMNAGVSNASHTQTTGPSVVREEEGWTPTAVDPEEYGARPRRPKQQAPPSPTQRSTFAMRPKPSRPEETMPPPHLRLQPQQPFVRPVSGMDHDDLGVVYGDIREWRSRLKVINAEIADAQAEGYSYIAEGLYVKGWLLIGRGVRFVPGVRMIEGRSKEDIKYQELQHEGGVLSDVAFWTIACMVGILLGVTLIAVVGLVVTPAPNVSHFLSFLRPLSNSNSIGAALATTFVPAVGACLFIAIALFVVQYAASLSGAVSISAARVNAFKATVLVLVVACCLWLTACGSLVFALEAFATNSAEAKTVASGSVYMAAFFLVLVINVAFISPALLMLQPLRLWRLIRRQRHAMTPRQRFRAIYPRVYDPSYATACCLVAVTFAATFSLIFPPIAPAVCLLLLLTLIAHRYLIGYVYARTHAGYTGGILQIWLLRCFADLTAFQPLLLGLIFLTRRLWVLGGVLTGAGVFIIIFVEGYTRWKTRLPGLNSLSPITQESLARFEDAAFSEKSSTHSEAPSVTSSPRRTAGPPRSSLASVFDMMSLTLAVTPSSAKRGPVPLPTEDLDDLTATERAARTNPNAPPRLPPLPFMTHSEEMQGILYSPELIAPPPVIWLPNDNSGVATSEAYDLERWHDLKTTLDVSFNVIPRKPDDPHQRNSP